MKCQMISIQKCGYLYFFASHDLKAQTRNLPGVYNTVLTMLDYRTLMDGLTPTTTTKIKQLRYSIIDRCS